MVVLIVGPSTQRETQIQLCEFEASPSWRLQAWNSPESRWDDLREADDPA